MDATRPAGDALRGRPVSCAPMVALVLLPGTLQPTATISGQVKFIAPRTGSKLLIEHTDPELGRPIVVDPGRTGKTPANAFDGYHRH